MKRTPKARNAKPIHISDEQYYVPTVVGTTLSAKRTSYTRQQELAKRVVAKQPVCATDEGRATQSVASQPVQAVDCAFQCAYATRSRHYRLLKRSTSTHMQRSHLILTNHTPPNQPWSLLTTSVSLGPFREPADREVGRQTVSDTTNPPPATPTPAPAQR